ncbi:endoglucanase E1, partial [Xylariomycetidae sp. FL0641]
YLWKAEAALHKPWKPDPGAVLFSQRPLPPRAESSFITSYALPLRAQGRDVVDTTGRRFRLASINWYGASDELFIPGGLEVRHRSAIAATVRLMGFNSVRLPYADEMVMKNPEILPHLVAANPDLVGRRALDVYAAVVGALTDAGVAVIVNNHITSAQWCCGADPCDAGWANDHLGGLCRVRQSEEEWIRHWEAVMAPLKDNPRVIGADLRNEVRGVWGTMPWAKWAAAAERCGNRLLKMNPDWLIVVEGTESGNDLAGVRARPVVLDLPGRVVYSAHVYAWSGWGSREGRYAKRSYASFVQAMRKYWAYLVEDGVAARAGAARAATNMTSTLLRSGFRSSSGSTVEPHADLQAPVWVGEFGAPRHPGAGDYNYWNHLLRYLKRVDADFGYWALNPRKPRDDAREMYSLLEDDWTTPILDYRMRDLTELMAGTKAGVDDGEGEEEEEEEKGKGEGEEKDGAEGNRDGRQKPLKGA